MIDVLIEMIERSDVPQDLREKAKQAIKEHAGRQQPQAPFVPNYPSPIYPPHRRYPDPFRDQYGPTRTTPFWGEVVC